MSQNRGSRGRVDRKRALGLTLFLLLGSVLAAPAFPEAEPQPSDAPPQAVAAPLELLEVTGMLEGIVPGGQGQEVVTLNVYGKLASGPLSSDCRFLDERGTAMEKDAFLQRYMKRVITLELEADSGAVVLFRVGS